MTMGDYIKQLREERQLTQEELGRLVGVNRDAVSKWEKGRVENIKRSTIKRLSEVFGVSPVRLMCFDDLREEPKPEMCDLFNECRSEDVYAMVDKLLMLDEYDRVRVRERIETLLEQDKYRVKRDTNGAAG